MNAAAAKALDCFSLRRCHGTDKEPWQRCVDSPYLSTDQPNLPDLPHNVVLPTLTLSEQEESTNQPKPVKQALIEWYRYFAKRLEYVGIVWDVGRIDCAVPLERRSHALVVRLRMDGCRLDATHRGRSCDCGRGGHRKRLGGDFPPQPNVDGNGAGRVVGGGVHEPLCHAWAPRGMGGGDGVCPDDGHQCHSGHAAAEQRPSTKGCWNLVSLRPRMELDAVLDSLERPCCLSRTLNRTTHGPKDQNRPDLTAQAVHGEVAVLRFG